MPVVDQKGEKGATFPPGVIKLTGDISHRRISIVVVVDGRGSGSLGGAFQRVGTTGVDLQAEGQRHVGEQLAE